MIWDKESLDKYHCSFTRKATDLVASNYITQKQYSLVFYQGIPDLLRKRLRSQFEHVVQGTLSSTNPPSVENALRIIWNLYDLGNIDAFSSDLDLDNSDDSDDSDDKDSSDDEKKRKGKEKVKHKKHKGKGKSKDKSTDLYQDSRDK